jgi:hypothetical protein
MLVLKALGGLFLMMLGVQMVTMRDVGVMRRFVVLAFRMVLCGGFVMLRSHFMVLGCFLMVMARIVVLGHLYLLVLFIGLPPTALRPPPYSGPINVRLPE